MTPSTRQAIMARRRGRRETNDFANDPLPPTPITSYRIPALPPALPNVDDYTEYARQILNRPPVNLDNRTWQPEVHPNRNRTRSGRIARVKLVSGAHSLFSPHSQTKARLGFSAPQDVMTCIRRKIRKEVLHAFQKAGKGGRQRKHRYTARSRIKC